MNCFLSNNLQDFADALYVVRGFQGDNLDKLRQNIKGKKVMGVPDNDAGVEVKTVNIPVEARKTKMEIDEKNIYKFGMGFDSTQVGDGNITNIVIKSRYSLLDLKCNKKEARLRQMLKWINEIVVEDINRKHRKAYKASDVKFEFARKILVNETDTAQIENIEANTKLANIDAIVKSGDLIDRESAIRKVCDELDLDYEDVEKRLSEEEENSELETSEPPEAEELEQETPKLVPEIEALAEQKESVPTPKDIALKLQK
jgi:hypothetical protein